MRKLLPILALLLLPISAVAQSWTTLPVDVLIPMNTSPTYPPGTPLTAAIANSGTVSSDCTVGSTCYFATFPTGFEVGANQGTCTNLGPIQMNGIGGALYPAQSLNYNNYAHLDSADSVVEEFDFSPWLKNTQFSITTCMTIGFPSQLNGNVYDMFMIQDSGGDFDVLQLAFSCPNDQIFGARVETWPSDDSGCVSLNVTPSGTATFTNGSTTVTGTGFATGTSWNNAVIDVGSGVRQGTGIPYTIASVQSATTLTLATPYTGTTGKQSYAVIAPAAQTYYLSTTWDYTSGTACYWVWTPQGAFLGNGCVAATGKAGTSNVRMFSNENGSNIGTYTEYQNIMMNWTATAPTGTAALTNGSTTVTGTNFTTGNAWNNGILNVGGATYTIASVQSATSLTLATPYSGSTGSASYAVELPLFWTQGSQTITFGALSNQVYGTAPFTVSATASSGLPVSFNSQTTATCTVSGTTVTLVGVGTCTIQATQPGNASYAAAAPVSQSFQVTQASQTVTFGALSNEAFGVAPFTVSATTSSGLAASFNSQTTGVCTVYGTTLTLVALGTCTIQATQAGNSDYAAATPVNQSFQVLQGSQTITFGALSNQALSNGSLAVSATASSGLPVSFNSQTTSVCSVSGNTVTLVLPGACTIQATQAGNTNYAAATPVNQSFQVTTQTNQTITFGPLPNLAYGTAPFTVSATASSSLTVSFSSQSTGVCAVSGTTVTLLAAGGCTIQATQAGNASYLAATPVNQSFQVTQASQTITFGALSNLVFGSAPFTVSASASSGLPVSFNSQTTSVCTVSGTTVTLVAVGPCTVQATQGGNTNYAAATPVNQSLQVTQASQTITFGALSNQALGAAPFTISATASSGLTVSFNSQTTAQCTVSGATVTLVALGTCTIQATQGGNSNYAAATPANQSFTITSGTATPITPYLEVNSGSWQQTASATVSSNSAVDLGPRPLTGGSWSWAGPNGFTSTSREIDNIPLSTGANVFVATYTNTSGVQSTLPFAITVNGTLPTTIIPYIEVSGGSWQVISSVSVSPGSTVNLGPRPLTGGSWSWTGPNGFTSTLREIDNIPLSVGTNVFVATYTNSSGVQSTETFTITVT